MKRILLAVLFSALFLSALPALAQDDDTYRQSDNDKALNDGKVAAPPSNPNPSMTTSKDATRRNAAPTTDDDTYSTGTTASRASPEGQSSIANGDTNE